MKRRVLRWGWVWALAPALALACASPEERFADHVERGARYAEQGDRQKALLEYNSALKIDPENADVNERVGDLLREEGAGEDAAFFYREAYRLDPERFGAAIKEARLVLFSDPARAADILNRLEKDHPDQSGIPRTRSELALMRNDVDGALKAAEAAVALAKDEPTNWLQLSRAHQAHIRAVSMTGGTPSDEMYRKALDALTRADEVGGGHLGARLERAKVLGAWPGHRTEAEQTYRDAVAFAAQSDEGPAAVVAAAEAAASYAGSVGESELERWALRQVVEAYDQRYDAWARLAELAEAQQAGSGEAVYQELLTRRPDDPKVSSLYAQFLARSGRGQDAVAHIEQVLEDGVDSPELWEQLLGLQLRRLQLANARATFVRMADAHPDDPITKRAEARLALVSGHKEKAAEILRELVTRDENTVNLRLLAIAEYRLDNLQQAINAIDRALFLFGGYQPDAMRLKAQLHHDAGEWRATLGSYELMVRHGDQLELDDKLRRARALYKTGMEALGRGVLERLLAEDPPPPGAAVQYAHREGARDPEGARRYLEAAFAAQPGHYDVLRMLTEADVQAGRNAEALARINEVVESRRVGPRVLLLRSRLLRDNGDFDAAEADALRAFESEPESDEAVNLLYEIYVAQGRVAEARKSFEEAEAAGVLHSGARLLLGRLALAQGDVDVAREIFQKVLQEAPDMNGAKIQLALVLAKQDQEPERALQLAQEAEEAQRRSPATAHALGLVYLEMGRYEAALQQLERAMRLAEIRDDALVPSVHYHRGLALRALDRNEEARKEFESALAADSEFPFAEDARKQLDGLRAQTAAAASS